MRSETQKNWNEYFNQKKKRSLGPFLLIILLLLAATTAFTIDNSWNIKMVDVFRVFREVTGIHDSYETGDIMNTMIQKVDSIETGNYEFLDQLLYYNNADVPTDLLNDWDSYIRESRNTLDHMKYHSTYSEFVGACYQMLDESKQLINLASSEKQFDTTGNSSISECIDQIYDSSDVIDNELMKAFDKNGIDYYEDEDYINYYYD